MNQSVRRRRVFYLSGFDPRGASHYHWLYRTQGRLQSAVNGLKLEVSGRRRVAQHVQGWTIHADDAHAQVTQTTYEFLSWDDIIRSHWATTPLDVLGDLWFSIRAYILSGLVARFAKASRKQLIPGLYPIVFLISAIVLGVLACAGGFFLVWTVPDWAVWIKLIVGIPVGLLILWGMAYLALKLGNRLAVFWLLRIYAFSARWAQGEARGLDERIQVFAARIAAAVREEELDEIQVVSHSVGTILAVPVMAQVLDDLGRGGENPGNQRLVLVTLGECIPLMSFQPQAESYRQDLQTLGRHPGLLWVDYTAPTDGACFPLLNPVLASGLEGGAGTGPHILSPRFFKLYSPERYKRLRRDWYGMHFLYLMATDYAYGYDFFAMTSGPHQVAELIEKHS